MTTQTPEPQYVPQHTPEPPTFYMPGATAPVNPPAPDYGPPFAAQPWPYQGPPAAAGKSVKRTNRRNWIILAAFGVVAFVLLAVVLAATPPQRQLTKITAAPATSAPVIAPTTNKPADAPKAAPTTKAPAPNPTTAMRAWIDDGGGQLTDALLGDFQAVSDAGTAMNVRGMHTGFLSLQRDVEKAQAFRPIPDAGAQREWAAALAAYARCATNGLTATRGGTVMSVDAELLDQSTADLDEGGKHLVALTARINEYTK